MGTVSYTHLDVYKRQKVVCLVSTACAPACDSSLRFYTTDWKPLADSQFISLPVMSEMCIRDRK